MWKQLIARVSEKKQILHRFMCRVFVLYSFIFEKSLIK